jgi:hypothetical protein
VTDINQPSSAPNQQIFFIMCHTFILYEKRWWMSVVKLFPDLPLTKKGNVVGRQYNKRMDTEISHNWQEESIEAKALWFQNLRLEERMEMLCTFTEFLMLVNPDILEQKNAEPLEGRVCVLSAT